MGLVSGSFFLKYPRHEKLVSINKRHTGRTNKEFNLRHDWNSLLSDDESLTFKHYSQDFFPRKEQLLRYLNDYTYKLGLNVLYNHDISNITQIWNDSLHNYGYTMQDGQGLSYSCRWAQLHCLFYKDYMFSFDFRQMVSLFRVIITIFSIGLRVSVFGSCQ